MKAWIPLLLLPLASGAWADLCPGSPGGPTVATPGSVGCTSMMTGSGVRTTYSVFADTILDWNTLMLPAGDELVFDFVGGNSVANRLGAGPAHRIDGQVSGNGRVGFFATGSNLEIGGSVSANEVVVSGLSLSDPSGFLTGGEYQLQGDGNFLTGWLSVDGMLEATSGDVIMAGSLMRVRGEARVRASGAIRGGAGETIDVEASGERRLTASGGTGTLLHLGDSRADLLEFVASGQISNGGRMEAGGGFGKVFLEVGPNGKILNEGTGVILGQATIMGDFDNDGVGIGYDEGDGLNLMNASVVKIPALKRPGGKQVSREQAIATNASMAGSADALRKSSVNSRTAAKRNKKPLLSRQSFFGMRGSRKGKSLTQR
ncbi:MAG: hypothetical protein AAGI48_04940 [Verrucomicrobiota bacterium]